MTFSRVSNSIAVGLLALCFVISLGRILTRQAAEGDKVKTIRFAHWQLEGGLRDAFDKLAREYEKLHPDVRIEQMPIPERVYPTWQQTQLVGETAPDIIELGMHTEEMLARYFLPISHWVEEPNPYNAGTDLEGIPWRATFIDGLSGNPAYSDSLVDYFGVPMSMFTLRVYYNVELLKRITGAERPPKTYDEFLELCRQTAAYRTPAGEPILPIAGSQYNGPFVMDRLFASQTQKLIAQLDNSGVLQPAQAEIAIGNLDGKWSLDTPAILDGLRLMQAVGRYMQPGFLQLRRDDAMFYFAQGHALMICSGSWDAPSIRQQAPFEIGVFRIPVPDRTQPAFGANVLGPSSEAGTQGGLPFGVVARSPHIETAIDFLRFLTSKQGNQAFSDASGWLPSVRGVVPPKEIQAFEPVTQGNLDGFPLAIAGYLFPDTNQLLKSNLYRIIEQGGDVEAFASSLSKDYARTLRSDLERQRKGTARNIEINDTSLAAYWSLFVTGEDPADFRKFDKLIEAQNEQEKSIRLIQNRLNSHPAP